MRVYFDSSILLGAGWPHVSVKLWELLRLARILNVGVFLPRAVELELERHWFRELDRLHGRFAAAEDQFLTWLGGAWKDDVPPSSYTIPPEMFWEDYAKAANHTKSHSGTIHAAREGARECRLSVACPWSSPRSSCLFVRSPYPPGRTMRLVCAHSSKATTPRR